MKVQMLKIVGWGLFYLFLLEVGLEVRAHWRGFDTILFGSFQRRDSEGAGAAMAKSEQGSMLSARRSTDKKPHEVRYWIASSSHAEDSYLARELVFPSRLETLLLSDVVADQRSFEKAPGRPSIRSLAGQAGRGFVCEARPQLGRQGLRRNLPVCPIER
jgi:hypothetical protein